MRIAPFSNVHEGWGAGSGAHERIRMKRSGTAVLEMPMQPISLPYPPVSAEFRFQDDGSYTADVVYDGKLESHQGSYTYDANKGMLTVMDKQGNSYAYAAKKPDDQTLLLVKGIKGTDVTLTLKKQQ